MINLSRSVNYNPFASNMFKHKKLPPQNSECEVKYSCWLMIISLVLERDIVSLSFDIIRMSTQGEKYVAIIK